LNAQVLVRATGLTLLLFVSGPSFAETCGSVIHEDSFEIPIVTTYNDASINGATDDGMNFTRIESTGLDWLDLTITFNLSYTTVKQRIADPSDELFGLRYANAYELHTLLFASVYQLPGIGEVPGADPGMAFMENFGEGLINLDQHFVIGFHTLGNGPFRESISYDCTLNQSVTAQGALVPTDASQFAGSFLVRAIP